LLDVGVAVLDEGQGWERATAQLLARQAQAAGGCRARLLAPFFVSQGAFSRVFEGDPGALRELELREYLDTLLLIRKRTEIRRSPAAPNVLTARTHVTMHLLDVRSGAVTQSLEGSDLGAGAVDEEAEAQALERVLGRLVPQMDLGEL
jgi:hypothetical protein